MPPSPQNNMNNSERLNNWKLHDSIRGHFGLALYREMVKDPNIIVLLGDLGYGLFDSHREDFPDRVINCGAAEACMLGVAVGLAMEGKIPFVYTISAFYARALETIHLYASEEQIPLRLVGSGRDNDYLHDGISHHGGLAQAALGLLKLDFYYPNDKLEIAGVVEKMVKTNKPSFISLRR